MQLAHVGEPEAPIYLNALDTELDGGGRVALPWRLAFAASPDLHPLRHALLGINAVLASRFAAEDDELAATGGAAMLDRLLTPLNRLGSERFLREARQKVWHNTLELHNVRVAGSQEYAVRLAELETGVAAYDRESTFTPPAVAPTRARGLGRAMLFAVGGPTEGLRDICR